MFGRRARRRNALRRYALTTVLVTGALMVAGVEPTNGPLALLSAVRHERVLDRRTGPEATQSAASTLRFRQKVFEARPAPERPEPAVEEPAETAEPVEAPATGGSVSEIIYAAAAEFGLSGDYLLSVASCESGLDPGAVNAAGYHGLFQFDETTWAAYGYGSIYDPVTQSRTAARLLAAGQSSRWPNCA
jgi:soluble lytic murein transglycosylase-like protein